MELIVTLILVGFILMFLETYLPGLIAGIAGAFCLVAAIILGYVRFGAQTGTGILAIVGALAVAGFWLYVTYLPESKAAKRFILHRTVGDIGTTRHDLLHQTGIAHSNLRPSGTALINGQKTDVVTEGGMIEKGTPVKVVAVEGLRVVVRQMT